MDLVREALFPAAGAAGKSRFGEAEYWDERYSAMRSESFDWYGTWNGDSSIQLRPHVLPQLGGSVSDVLNIGCGNSRLSEELHADGYKNVVGIDVSQKVIEAMSARFAATPGMSFLQMDATKMTFGDASFDVVFEKGALDAIYTASSDAAREVIHEVVRVLRPGGVFVSVSFGSQETRREYNSTTWVDHGFVQLKKTDTGNLFLYTMRKPKASK
eukprot:TRINITY_DN23937_c0_g1_i1.p1 TRINITY_DN23937_c0_g1~~TRINITY_DN23937_c0_g1_i1.p1  ORF type:complete len:214 (-),score=49.53 TRINITY_DN23937_c0_g1_i1:377-1018(-)